MTTQQNTNKLYDKILNEQNIYSAIYSLESYVFDKGLLDTEVPIAFPDENGETREFLAKNDLELYYALSDKHNVVLLEKVILLCKNRLKWLFSDKSNLFTTKVYFKLKSYDEVKEEIKFRPMHTASLIDLICMVSILIQLMYEDNYKDGVRNLSDLSKLIPHNFYGNVPSTNVQFLFHKWQNKYKEYTENVIEHCRAYQRNHNYLTEVSLDIKNFFPTISPKWLYNYIIEKLSSTYKEDCEMLKAAVTKLLFFKIEKENIQPWIGSYYSEDCEIIFNDLYMNCGIPQGLPQSYFFGNLCMIEVKNLLLKDEYFKGDAYFYVDDSVIYLQSELSEEEFKVKIQQLNKELAEMFYKAEGLWDDMSEYVFEDYLNFQKCINYKIQFHEEGKSTFTPIDETDNQYGIAGVFAREVSLSSSLVWNLDEIDDQISLDKLNALDKVITTEINKLKDSENKSNRNASRLKLLRRFKKFFLYRNRLLRIREVGGPNEEIKKDFKERFLSADKNVIAWFEQNDEDIFLSEYRLIIQKESKEEAISLCNDILQFERSLLKHENSDAMIKSLFFTKDVQAAIYIKSLVQDSYMYLSRWANVNYNGLKNLKPELQIEKFRHFMIREKAANNILSMVDDGFEKRKFTKFIIKASDEYKRKILNVFFSEVIGVIPTDALIFTKTSSRKLLYTELRILVRLRNRNFSLEDFEEFIEHINYKDVSNLMEIDMGLLNVIDKFITRAKRPDWVDNLILTHRLTKGLWYNGSKFLNSYTLHNEEHAVTLIYKSMELINRVDYFTIKDVDYYILFLACYLHDISMVIHPDLSKMSSDNGKNLVLISELMTKMSSEVKTFFADDTYGKKNSKMKGAGRFLVEVFQKVYEYFENEVRANHASDSAKFIIGRQNSLLSYLESPLLSIVADVSRSHGYDVQDVYGLKSRAKDDTISLKYLMMLIRLADLMDVANDRVNYYLLRQNLAHLTSTSRFHWVSHLVTDRIELKTKYEVVENDDVRMSSAPIVEIINLNLYLNFQQLATMKKKEQCKFCNCIMGPQCITIDILNGGKPERECSQTPCSILCHWMMTKHQWLITELVALNDYLYSVNHPMFKTHIKLNIHYRNEMKLDPDMFDSIHEFLKV